MSEGKIVLKISDLSCSYNLQDKYRVLYIPELSFERGKIVFLLGASGSGKSTLLETLGLMNNTLAGGSVKLFNENGDIVDYSTLWGDSNQSEINRIRKDYLSFIFQETNLMENFTAYENICLSQMIKNNSLKSAAIGGAQRLMEQVRLPFSEVNFEKLSVNLSGGQRQRVSFVRALNTDYKLLLCDEPTGNLDEVNANELLSIVKNNLGQDRTAIIVSHDINNAIKYADQIVLITKKPGSNYGEVSNENVFDRSYWQDLNSSDLSAFREKLRNLFGADEEVKQGITVNVGSRHEDSRYRKLFIKKEGKVLYGKNSFNLLILAAIVSITLLAIGFANGTLNYLDLKLNDKFVNWLPVKIPSALSSPAQVTEFTKQLNDSAVRKQFLVDTVTTYKVTWLPLFYGDSANSTAIEQGRLVAFDDPIIKHLFDSDNLFAGRSNYTFQSDHDFSIVVTKKMLDRLHYPLDAKLLYLDNQEDPDTTPSLYHKFKVPVPIRAVVKEIPGRNNFLILNEFFLGYKEKTECIFNYRDSQRKKICFYISGDRNLAKRLRSAISKAKEGNTFNLHEEFVEEIHSTDNYFDEYSEEEPPEEYAGSTTGQNQVNDLEMDLSIRDTCEQIPGLGSMLIVEFDPIPHYYSTTEGVYKKILALPEFVSEKEKVKRIFDFSNYQLREDDIINDYLCINFKSLDKVDLFSTYFNQTLNPDLASIKDETNIIELDSGAINEKRNFNYISKMTWLISGLLILFSILSISMFISNLLKTHLSKVKRNIGTYKAFGLSDQETVSIYIAIMLRFIFIGMIISIGVAWTLGKGIQKWLESTLQIKDKVDYFQLFSGKTILVLLVVIGVALYVSYTNIKRIISKTPGDLIYNRG